MILSCSVTRSYNKTFLKGKICTFLTNLNVNASMHYFVHQLLIHIILITSAFLNIYCALYTVSDKWYFNINLNEYSALWDVLINILLNKDDWKLCNCQIRNQFKVTSELNLSIKYNYFDFQYKRRAEKNSLRFIGHFCLVCTIV